jgi:hypothetical protein
VFGRTVVVEAKLYEYKTVVGRELSGDFGTASWRIMARKKFEFAKKTSCVS